MKICSKCKQEKSEDSFAWRSRERGTRNTTCKSCMKDYARQHYLDNTEMYKAKSKVSVPAIRARNKAWLKEYLQEHPCECGEADIEVLQFDHNDPLMDFKARRVSRYLSGSLEALQREVAKCTVRCANCHYRLTRKQMGWSWD